MRAFILAGLLVACGGVAGQVDELGQLEWDRDALGTTSQDYTSKSRPHFTYGVLQNLSACMGLASDICVVPSKKATVYTFVSGSNDFKTGMRNAMLSVAQSSSQNFTFTEGTAATTFLEINDGSSNTFCNSSNVDDVTTYYLVGQAGSQSLLAETLPGVYKRRSDLVIHLTVCQNKISSRGATSQEDLFIQSHVMKHATLEMIGLGARNDAGSLGFASNRSLTPISARTTMTTGEGCASASYTINNNNTFALSGSCVSD